MSEDIRGRSKVWKSVLCGYIGLIVLLIILRVFDIHIFVFNSVPIYGWFPTVSCIIIGYLIFHYIKHIRPNGASRLLQTGIVMLVVVATAISLTFSYVSLNTLHQNTVDSASKTSYIGFLDYTNNQGLHHRSPYIIFYKKEAPYIYKKIETFHFKEQSNIPEQFLRNQYTVNQTNKTLTFENGYILKLE